MSAVKESRFRGVEAQDEHLESGCCINVEGKVAATLHKMQQVLNYRKEILAQRILQRPLCFCQQLACYFWTTTEILFFLLVVRITQEKSCCGQQ